MDKIFYKIDSTKYFTWRIVPLRPFDSIKTDLEVGIGKWRIVSPKLLPDRIAVRQRVVDIFTLALQGQQPIHSAVNRSVPREKIVHRT